LVIVNSLSAVLVIKHSADGVADRLREDGDDGVAEATDAVQPMGNPMSHSTQSGFNSPPSGDGSVENGVPVGQRDAACANVTDRRPLGVCCVLCKFAVYVSATVGVGQDEDAVATVRRTNAGSRYTMPFRVIPDRGKITQDPIEPSLGEHGDIFKERDARSTSANGTDAILPEARTIPRQASSSTSLADVLTRESPGDDVDSWKQRKIDIRNIAKNLGIGKSLTENTSRIHITFNRPHRAEPGSVQPELKTADARE
jgi:hypothetical protein